MLTDTRRQHREETGRGLHAAGVDGNDRGSDGVGRAPQSDEKQNVVVHLSHFTDDLHRCFMAVKLGTLMQKSGRKSRCSSIWKACDWPSGGKRWT